MADEENEIEVTDTTVADESAPAEETAAEGETAPETEEPEASPGEEAETEEGEEGEEDESEEEAPALNTKFKAGVYNKATKQLEQKEFDIDPRFHELMKTPEGEKAVREMHEKAFGLDSVKDRFTEAKQENTTLRGENEGIKGSIEGLRNIYQSATSPNGNIHKLDAFFEKLQIPQQAILKWAYAKVELSQMPTEQQNAIIGQLQSERQAEELAQQRTQMLSQNAQQSAQMKDLMVETVLARPEINQLQQAYDDRVGKPGAFKQAVFREGMLAWNTEGIDLPPQEAVQRVITNYGLGNGKHGLPPGSTANGTTVTTPAGKRVVQRTTQTIPNVNGNSQSPLAKKPKSMDDVLKYRKEQHGF